MAQLRLNKKMFSLGNTQTPKQKNSPNLKETKTPSYGSQFLTRKDLLGLNLNDHVHRLYNHLEQKTNFIQQFHKIFVDNSELDCRIFGAPNNSPFFESDFVHSLPNNSIKDLGGLRVAAVDGGLGMKNYLGVHLTIVKVGVVCYEFRSNSPPSIRNFPPFTRDENYVFFSDLYATSDRISNKIANYRRALAENQMLLQYIQSEPAKPDLIILDGSLLPPPPPHVRSQNEKIYDTYQDCLHSYVDLFKYAIDHKILVVGSVKDTGSTVLRDLLLRAFPRYLSEYPSLHPLRQIDYRIYLQHFSDPDLIYHLLEPNQRTTLFHYNFDTKRQIGFPEYLSSFLSQHPVCASYCKISEYDLPLRLEYLTSSKDSNLIHHFSEVLQLILPLSKINPQCTIPLPQIEAHLQAHLSETESNMVMKLFEDQFRLHHLKSTKHLSDSQNLSSTTNSKALFGTFLSKRHDRLDEIF